MLNLQIPYLKKHSFDKDSQPSKLKFLPSCHLATNSFGLGRLFYKSNRQLQNSRHHGDQNGRNLEGWQYSMFIVHPPFLLMIKSLWCLSDTKDTHKVTVLSQLFCVSPWICNHELLGVNWLQKILHLSMVEGGFHMHWYFIIFLQNL